MERDSGHHIAGDYLANLSALCLDVHRGIRNDDFLLLSTHRQTYIRSELRIYVDEQASALIRVESLAKNFDLVAPHGQGREIVKAIGIRLGGLYHRCV